MKSSNQVEIAAGIFLLLGIAALIFLAVVVRMTPCDPEAPAVRLLLPGCFFYIHLPREDGEVCPWPSPRALM